MEKEKDCYRKWETEKNGIWKDCYRKWETEKNGIWKDCYRKWETEKNGIRVVLEFPERGDGEEGIIKEVREILLEESCEWIKENM